MNPITAIREAIQKQLGKYAAGALELRVFTALLPVQYDVEGLHRQLDRTNGDGATRNVLGVQSLRWVLVQPTLDNDDPRAMGATAPFALLLSFVYDGAVEGALEDVVRLSATKDILLHCRGTHRTNPVGFLKKHAIDCGYMFRDLGTLEQTSGDLPKYAWDATKSEILTGFEIQQDFEAFYVKHQGKPAGELRKHFIDEFTAEVFPFPLSPVERRLPHEERMVRRLSEVVRRMQSRVTNGAKDGVRRRGAHAKAHGFLRGTFRVEHGIPPEFAKGLFAVGGKSFPVRARLSNAKSAVQADKKPDARGLAMSVQLPTQDHPPEQFLFPTASPLVQRQDFLLFSDSEFFVSDTRQAAIVFSIISTGGRWQQGSRLLAFVLGEGAWRQAYVMGRTLMKKVAHPFEPKFNSAVPYLLGDEYVVKYSVEVVDRDRLSCPLGFETDDALREVLRTNLATGPVELRFYLHAVKISVSTPGALLEAVENATASWSRLNPTRVLVATVEFDLQDPTTDEAMGDGEAWSFNPWNALKAHRPIGSINRARLSLMEDSVEFRKRQDSKPSLAAVRDDCTGRHRIAAE